MATQGVTQLDSLTNLHLPDPTSRSQTQTLRPGTRLAQGLGWFSIGLGIAEVVAPRALAKWIGVKRRPVLFRLFGLREIANGIGILSAPQSAKWIWARVAGDAMDLAYLGKALASNRKRNKPVAATAAVAGVTAVDFLCSAALSSQSLRQPVRVQKTVSVNRPPEQVYQFWRDFRNLQRFLKNVESVQPDGEKRAHWVMKSPA